MNRNAILTDDQRLERNQRIESNRLKRVENNQPIVLIQSFHSLSFIFFSPSQIRSSNLLRFHSSSLSTNDQILLTNIFSAYERTCVSLKYEQHRNIPKNDTFSLQKFMNSCGHMYTALIDYFKFIPEFSNLSFSFKKSLIKNNLNQIFRLNSALVIKASGSVDDPDFPFFRRIFPPDLFIDLHKCIIALLPFIHDPILLKLIFIVLMFSTHLSLRYECDSNESESTDSTIVMFNAQSIYVELLWRYILSRASNYRQAVLLFSSFITCLIYSQNVSIKLQEYISRTTSNQAGHLAPIMQVMWSKDQKQ